MVNYGHYTYHVRWSEKHHGYVGKCAEFPGISHVDETQDAARKGIVELVKQSVVDMANNGEAPPVPFVDRPYKN
jgi:hypothetical protein